MATIKTDPFVGRVLLLNATLPGFWIIFDWWNDRLGANPHEVVIRTTGVVTLLLVLITLAMPLIARIFRWYELLKHRRQIGLFSFFYGSFHLLTYLLFDRGGELQSLPADVVKRPFIALGMLSYLLMIPLAVTSTDKMIRRLGIKRWKSLHKLTYLIALGGVAHFWMIVKSDLTYPLAFAAVVGLLVLTRLWRALPI